MIFVPRNVSLFHSLHFAGEQDTSSLHCKHEVSNLHLLYFTVDGGLVVVVLTVKAVLSFAQLSWYVNMLAIILSTYCDNIVTPVYHPTLKYSSLVPRHFPAFQCCTLKSWEGPEDETKGTACLALV